MRLLRENRLESHGKVVLPLTDHPRLGNWAGGFWLDQAFRNTDILPSKHETNPPEEGALATQIRAME